MSNKTDEQLIVGLDIGTTKICAIVGQMKENGKINVLGMGEAKSMGGVSRGVVANIAKTVDAIKKAVDMATTRSNCNIRVVNVGIAGQHIKSMQHSGLLIRSNGDSEIDQKDLDTLEQDMYKLATDPGTEILHVLPQEYIVDNQEPTRDPVGMMGVRLEGNFHIITGQVAAARNIIKCVEKAGLQVGDLIVEPIASAQAVLMPEEIEAGVALVDIGGGTSDLAIFQGGRIRHTAVIPYGGEIVTSDIQDAFSLLPEQAEALKVKFGGALPEAARSNEIVVIKGLPGRKPREILVKNLSHVIHARVKEIFELIDDQILISGLKNKLHGGIVITGGGSQLKNIDQLMEFVTGMEVRMGFPNQHLSKGMVDEVKSPMYATGIGLVLKGFESGVSGGATMNQKSEKKPEKQKIEKKWMGSFANPLKGFTDWLKEDDDVSDFK